MNEVDAGWTSMDIGAVATQDLRDAASEIKQRGSVGAHDPDPAWQQGDRASFREAHFSSATLSLRCV